MNHINSFLDAFGISGGGKAWWMALEVVGWLLRLYVILYVVFYGRFNGKFGADESPLLFICRRCGRTATHIRKILIFKN
jgi:hypothetical protein